MSLGKFASEADSSGDNSSAVKLVNQYLVMKHFFEPRWDLQEGEIKILWPPLPGSLLSSKQYQERHPTQTRFTTEDQGVERPNGKRQLSSLELKGKYFRSSIFDYVRETGPWHLL